MGKSPSTSSRTQRRRAELEARKQRALDTKRREVRREAGIKRVSDFIPDWLSVAVAMLAALIVVGFVGIQGMLDSALPVAGDQVTHNWWLIEFRDRLTSGARVFGWTQDLANGFLFGFFYFPLPPIIFTAVSFVLPDAQAIKLMAALSVAIIPIASWWLANGLGLRRVARAVVPLVSLAALLSTQPQFVGGTLYATLTGEFSYAYGLAFGMFAIGEAARVTRGDGKWWLVAVFSAASVLSHVQAALVALVAVTVILTRHRRNVSRFDLATIAALTVALSLWWTLPVLSMRAEALGDGHQRVSDVLGWIFHIGALPTTLCGIAGLAIGVARRSPGSRAIASLALAGPLVMFLTPGSFVWNVRAMPWTLVMCALGVAYLIEALVERFAHTRPVVLCGLVLACLTGLSLPLVVPDNRDLASAIRDSQYGGASMSGTRYLEELADYLRDLEPGRAMMAVPPGWVGTIPARDWVTALPLLTGGKITSPISLYYEASRSTPSLEHTHSLVSEVPHASLSWLPYGTVEEFELGLATLRLHGIRYYIVGNQRMYELAEQFPNDLRRLHVVGLQNNAPEAHQWVVYEVRNSRIVDGITVPIEIAQDIGDEKSWARAGVDWLRRAASDPTYPQVLAPSPTAPEVSTPTGRAVVSDVVITDDRISFNTSRIGSPVLIRVSHSSRWKALGATGPWRAAPNYMVVTPTASHVELHFSPTWGQLIGPWASLLGVVGVVIARRVRRRPTSD